MKMAFDMKGAGKALEKINGAGMMMESCLAVPEVALVYSYANARSE